MILNMLWWLESQNTSVIALLVFAFCYLLAAIILGVAVAFARHPVSHELSPRCADSGDDRYGARETTHDHRDQHADLLAGGITVQPTALYEVSPQ